MANNIMKLLNDYDVAQTEYMHLYSILKEDICRYNDLYYNIAIKYKDNNVYPSSTIIDFKIMEINQEDGYFVIECESNDEAWQFQVDLDENKFINETLPNYEKILKEELS